MVLLPGTQVKALDTGKASFASFTGGRAIIDFGLERGPFTNKSCGVAIGLGKYLGRQKSNRCGSLQLGSEGGTAQYDSKRAGSTFSSPCSTSRLQRRLQSRSPSG